MEMALPEDADLLARVAAGDALEIVGRPDAKKTLALRTYVTQVYLPHSWLDATEPPGRACSPPTSCPWAGGWPARRCPPTTW